MPLGPGTTDAQGVRLYGEDDDTGPLFSDFLNLGLESVSDQLDLVRDDVDALEVVTTSGSWVQPPLNSGWTNETSNPLQYKVHHGQLFNRGRATTSGASVTPFIYPAGFRPDIPASQITTFIVDATGPARVSVNQVGVITMLTAGALTNVSLANVRFLAV